MNPWLAQLQPYPFERMAGLKAGVLPPPGYPPVMLSIGEPRHPPPEMVVDALADRAALRRDLAAYPATRGSEALREAIADWVRRRFHATLDPAHQILPVSGTREALFSFAQAALSGSPESLVILPNPFYQIYEGAALLRGATPYFVNCTAANDYLPDYRAVPEAVWARCELLYLCSPGNPTGRTLDRATLVWLLEQAERHDFVIAADECYSEIYFDEATPPVGLLDAAHASGREDCRRCIVFHSLSKRSNLPGLRSGFVAGDAGLLDAYFNYRTYQGSALPNGVQAVSALAWQDEAHVIANRDEYRRAFAAVTPILAPLLPLRQPEGAFYHWVGTPGDDQAFARALFAERNITVLPGSYLARPADGINPGSNHVRIAWVAPVEDCIAAATLIADWLRERDPERHAPGSAARPA